MLTTSLKASLVSTWLAIFHYGPLIFFASSLASKFNKVTNQNARSRHEKLFQLVLRPLVGCHALFYFNLDPALRRLIRVKRCAEILARRCDQAASWSMTSFIEVPQFSWFLNNFFRKSAILSFLLQLLTNQIAYILRNLANINWNETRG